MDLLMQGLVLMVIGMATVFAFLVLMIVAMNRSAAFFKKFAHLFPEEEATSAKAASATAASTRSGKRGPGSMISAGPPNSGFHSRSSASTTDRSRCGACHPDAFKIPSQSVGIGHYRSSNRIGTPISRDFE